MATNPQIILIDGPAGSGKTTFAAELQRELNCQVIHLDDHYNGWDEALSNELTNVLETIVTNFLAGVSSEIKTFDWHKYRFEGNKIIEPGELLIIEGVGSGQSSIRGRASKLYWVEAEAELALKRVIARDGIQLEERIKAWQIREAKHFSAERTRDFADFIITTT